MEQMVVLAVLFLFHRAVCAPGAAFLPRQQSPHWQELPGLSAVQPKTLKLSSGSALEQTY